MPLAVDNSIDIRRVLLQHADEAHVDSCEWMHDPLTGRSTASFVSERFATCRIAVERTHPDGYVSEDDILFMARYASDELGRHADEMGCMGMFGVSTGRTPGRMPEGMSFEIIFEDDELLVEPEEDEALHMLAL